MNKLKDFTLDELISEIRTRDEGYFVGVIPITWVGDTFGRRNLTKDELDIIQEEFQESQHLDDTLEYVLDYVQNNDLVESEN